MRVTLAVIENTPTVSCPACGESYFTVVVLVDGGGILSNQTSAGPGAAVQPPVTCADKT